MCEHGNKPPVADNALFKPASQVNPFTALFPLGPAASSASAIGGLLTSVSAGSRRRRLWEIPRHCHCPVVGVCLPIPTLRKILDKVLVGKTVASDYDLHVGAVSECGARNKVSDAMQRELDRRYDAEVKRFAKAKTTQELEALWREAVDAGDLPAALWASLTHARCDGPLQEAICRDVHMIQHQAGASARADLKRVHALMEENGVLTRELARVQQRSTQWQAERIAECERLNGELLKARAEALGRDTLIAELRQDNARLRESTPELQSRSDLTLRVAELKARVRALEDERDEHRRESRRETERAAEQQAREERNAAAAAAAKAEEELMEGLSEPPEGQANPLGQVLASRSILCVGGRNSHMPILRKLVERQGGRFAHHDGGIEDNSHRLDASLAAADLVICQTGCLSHNAYWLVKDHCKRTGKRCVYLESPSVAGFVRGLAQIPVKEADAG